MRSTAREIGDKLNGLAQQIAAITQPGRLCHPEQLHEWTGADIRITSNLTWEPTGYWDWHDLLVRTRHAGDLTWLFLNIRDAFSGWLNFRNKYGFYGALADAALRHLASHQPEADDPRPLLESVLAQARDALSILQEDGDLPLDDTVVLHFRDQEGRQFRSDLHDIN